MTHDKTQAQALDDAGHCRSVNDYLRSTRYPGRGIILGTTQDGGYSITAYFIMGRSFNSRNRIFVPVETGLRTAPWRAADLEDPSLVIYHALRQRKDSTLITNGDQTDSIDQALNAGKTWHEALAEREFEPDAPHFTPRIEGLLQTDGSYQMAILRAADAAGTKCARDSYDYPATPGKIHLITTYMDDGNPLPSFEGEPLSFDLPEELTTAEAWEAWADELWESLDEDNKVALYVGVQKIQEAGAAPERVWNEIYNRRED